MRYPAAKSISVDGALAARAAIGISRWLEKRRAGGGYAGPVVHWWRDALIDCRPGFDWRYEGIISGYLTLARDDRGGGDRWRKLARQAGDDLVAAQDPETGHFARSRFELNPGTAGTPHEAAASIGLLRLGGEPYVAVAKRNLDALISRLWDVHAGSFRDHSTRRTFVPNKAATMIEALVLLGRAVGDDRYVETYARPTAAEILRHQVRRPGSHLDGAIAQNSFGAEIVRRYFPFYVARCIPGLVAIGAERCVEAALAAARFVLRWREADGGFPQVVYDDERVGRHPRWIAGAGDILRALASLKPYGLDADLAPTEAWLVSGLQPTGGIATARGFAAQARRAENPRVELRDLLGVAGWADKALRYFVERVDPAALTAEPAFVGFETECVFLGRQLTYREDAASVEVRERGRVVYRLAHGAGRPDVVESWMAVK